MRRDNIALLAAGAVVVAAFAVLGASEALHARVPLLLLLQGTAFAGYACGLRLAFRTGGSGATFLVIMGVVAVVARVMLIPVRPDLSTDIYRYAWEGRVVLEGVNPFATAPADSSLLHLRDADFSLINHRPMATIYPPLAQGVFALAVWIRPGFVALKALFVLFDLATIAAVMMVLRARGLPLARALVYAWSPLVILETAHSGHMDAVGAFFLVAGVFLVDRGRSTAAGAALGASILAKYVAAALVPFLVARRRWRVAAVVAVVAAAGFVPFLDAGPRLLDSLRAYGGSWWFNGPPFMALAGLLGDPMLARRLLAGTGIAFAFAAAWRERDAVRYAYLVMACMLLLSPTVYPWYLVWIVPFLCVFPNRAWIAFSGLVMLSYWVWRVQFESGAWLLPGWVLVLEYVPFYALLAWRALRPRAAAAGGSHA